MKKLNITPAKSVNEFILYLNEIGCPEDDKKSNGGRVPDSCNYGLWLQRNDRIAFCVGFNEFKYQS